MKTVLLFAMLGLAAGTTARILVPHANSVNLLWVGFLFPLSVAFGVSLLKQNSWIDIEGIRLTKRAIIFALLQWPLTISVIIVFSASRAFVIGPEWGDYTYWHHYWLGATMFTLVMFLAVRAAVDPAPNWSIVVPLALNTSAMLVFIYFAPPPGSWEHATESQPIGRLTLWIATVDSAWCGYVFGRSGEHP